MSQTAQKSKKVKRETYDFLSVKQENGFKTLNDLAAHARDYVAENSVEELTEFIPQSQIELKGRTYQVNEKDFKALKSEIVRLFDDITKPVKFASAYIGFVDKINKAVEAGDKTLDVSADQLDMVVEFYSLITFKTYDEGKKIEFVQKALNKVYSALYEDRQYLKILGDYLKQKKDELLIKNLKESESHKDENVKIESENAEIVSN